MKHYSFRVFSHDEVDLSEHGVVLEHGINVFTTFTKDLPAFLSRLERAKVRVQEVNLLAAPETPRLHDLLLPGETPAVLEAHAGRLRT